ncbi:hypothetical protein SAMD00019534_041950 [Acytostelium subglobosum LB1]|uniref:hypothetical protein n=1 Tax=Acytostelium subglobosum LB1 TaxID=1410327 RepID=UPI000644F029|nr:hypothetical protein SAMD00019534_041950 [Acytostelium subglobosum LB1]GAM21020.1 hypothetical protein SAMD00019534_041950 [Acytostelium subglobosum LB1]|eukprot:XP_012756154.1 hypothetical protein SAMD00019534_041950 [Acytostelium subglobosum LB1]
MKTDIKIVLVGDDGVGKTTIISSLVSDGFVEQVQRVVPDVTKPADIQGLTCATRIIDTCNDVDHIRGLNQMKLEVKHADAILLVYSYERLDSFFSIRTKWIPMIQQIQAQHHTQPVPIIIVGNKLDMVDESEAERNQTQFGETIQYITDIYQGTVRWMQCSTRSMFNIHELLDTAQSLVLFPEETLYNRQENSLTPLCERALRRIFLICDLDNDGSLNDREINYLQQRCSHQPLSNEEIANLKKLLRNKVANGVDDNGFTIEGFLFMNLIFLSKGQHLTWGSIRSFKYDDNLQLSNDYLHPQLTVPNGCRVELSADGLEWLKTLFNRFDANGDGLLSSTDLARLFATAPAPAFGTDQLHSVETSPSGELTLGGFLSLWEMLAQKDHRMALEYFAYFGYESIMKASTTHLVSVQKKNRNLFNCYLMSTKGCGKSTLINTLLGKPSTKPVPSSVCVPLSLSQYLVIHEIDNVDKVIQDQTRMNECDTVCLLWDETVNGSLEFATRLYQSLKSSNPHLEVVYLRAQQHVQPQQQQSPKPPVANNNNNTSSSPTTIDFRRNEPTRELAKAVWTAARNNCNSDAGKDGKSGSKSGEAGPLSIFTLVSSSALVAAGLVYLYKQLGKR